MTPGRNVYIPNLVFHDYEDAKRFGQLIQLSKGSIDTISLDDVIPRFQEKLTDSHHEDWILMSGSPILNVIACVIMLDLHGRLNLLQWDGIMKEYKPFKISDETTNGS